MLWSRFDDFNWDDIEPVRTDSPTYDWTAVSEQDLLTAVDSGGQIIGIVLFTPEWAHKYPGIACGPIKQEAFSAFAQFLQALVQRYGQPPFNVKYWELGNEPDVDKNLVSPHNGFGCWGEAGDAYFGGGYYAEMLKVVYPAIKAVDPSAQVLVGGLLLNCDPLNPPENPPGSGNRVDCTPSRFFEGILANGGGDFFDGVSYHAYDYYGLETGVYGMGNWNSLYNTTGPVLVTKGRYLKSLLAQYNQAGKYLINTEVGLLCGRDGNEPECQQDAFVQTKSYYVAEAYASALAEGLRGNVWYSLPGWRGTELMDINKQPVPAFDALRFSAAQLKGAVYAGEIGQYPGVKGYEFTRAGKKFWFLWSLDGVDHAIQLPSVPAAIYDVYGIAQKPKQDLLVTIAPLYIEWGQ